MTLTNSLNLYLACEDLNFSWDERNVLEFDRLWSEGKGLFEIAEIFNRDPDEVAILVIDRARQGIIKPRKGGLWGEEYFAIRKEISQRSRVASDFTRNT